MSNGIKVKVVKETSTKVTVFFPILNRKMPVPREEFEKRIENGTYTLVGS